MRFWKLISGHRRRRIAAALALLIAVAVVGGIVAGAGAGSSSPTASGNPAGAPSGAATVQRRDLVQTDTESGTLSYASPQTVYDRLSGTITWLPKVGRVIKPGQALFKVNGQPVTLMDGTTPAYRDLMPSDSSGQDILELNRNLVRLGFDPDGIVVDDTWQAATTAGVEALQASLGETETGSLSLGQVVFLPGDQLVSTVNATLGSTGASGQGNSSPSSNASDPAPAAGPEFASLETHSSQPSSSSNAGGGHQPGSSTNSESLKALIALLKAEIAELKAANKSGSGSHSGSPSNGGSSPSSNASGSNHGGSSSSSNGGNSSSNGGNSPSNGAGSSSNGGSGSGNASAVLQTATTQLIVTVDLDASKQSEAKVGEPVTVQLPNGSTIDGRITAVSPVAQSSSNSGNGNGSGNNGSNNNGSNNNNNNSNNGSNSGSGSTIPVTITLQGHHAGSGLDQASVSVNFAQAEAKNVLSVPVTALLATAGGGYAVQEAAAPHRLIPVTTGLFAAGYVQISSQGIYPGLEVTDSQG